LAQKIVQVGEQEIYGAPPIEAARPAYVFFFVRVTYAADLHMPTCKNQENIYQLNGLLLQELALHHKKQGNILYDLNGLSFLIFRFILSD
jgi:hypothetical protein